MILDELKVGDEYIYDGPGKYAGSRVRVLKKPFKAPDGLMHVEVAYPPNGDVPIYVDPFRLKPLPNEPN